MCYCDHKQHHYVHNGTVKYRTYVDSVGKYKKVSGMIPLLHGFENDVKTFSQV